MKGDTMTKTDTSREAFAEWFCKNYPGPDTIIHNPHWHAPKIFRAATHAILTERDALQARAERAEAGLKEIRDMGVVCASDFAANTLAQLDAEPAGVSEPAGVKVKPLEWVHRDTNYPTWEVNADVMGGVFKAKIDTGEPSRLGNFPLFINGSWDGKKHQTLKSAKAAAQNVYAALETGQTPREVWEQAKEAAADYAKDFQWVLPMYETAELNEASDDAACSVQEQIATAIRAMPYPGDSQ